MAIRESTFGKALARKALALPLSVALAAGFAPPLAFAADAEAGAGAASSGLRAASVTTLATPTVYSEYLPVLFHAANGIEEFEDDYLAAGSAQWAPEYCVFDIGNDGVPELLVRAANFAGNKVVHVFTVKSGKLVDLGSYVEGTYGTAGTEGGKLFVAGWGTDRSYVNSVTISGNKIVSKLVKSGKATAASPSNHVQVVTDYLAAQSANWITTTSVSDYAELKSDGKYSLSKATVAVASGGAYTGSAKTPAVTVKFMGTTLTKNTDYKVAYASNKNAGTAKVTVTGTGNYKDTASSTFTIAKAANPMVVKGTAKTFTAASVAGAAQSYKPITFTKKAQGTVKYASASTAAVAKVVTVNASTGAVTVKKGAAKGTYAVKVKVTAAGNANYKALSSTVEFKVTVK